MEGNSVKWAGEGLAAGRSVTSPDFSSAAPAVRAVAVAVRGDLLADGDGRLGRGRPGTGGSTGRCTADVKTVLGDIPGTETMGGRGDVTDEDRGDRFSSPPRAPTDRDLLFSTRSSSTPPAFMECLLACAQGQ